MASAYEPSIIVLAPEAETELTGEGAAVAELARVHVPHWRQNDWLGMFAAPQLQHSSVTGLVKLSGRFGVRAGEGGMGAPGSSRCSAADDTSESHSPQNAVSASTGAPHVGQASWLGT
jgi:hypothetical protein